MDQSNNTESEPFALFGIGSHPLDKNALVYSKIITSALDLHPVLLHVAKRGSSGKDAQAILDSTKDEFPEDTADHLILKGSPKTEILRELERKNYKLLILGSSIRDADQPVPSLSRELALRSKTSVLVVRNPPQQLRQILICTGAHTISLDVISWGIDLAKSAGVRATILHVASGAPAMYTGLSALEEGISDVLERDHALAQHLRQSANMAEEAGVDARIEFRHGMVIEEILRSCEMEVYDLVVIGAPLPLIRIEQLLMGRVAPKLLASCKFPTVIVRNNGNSSV
jgi:nucleotide-binding universal stress UspA family protein